MKTAANKNIIRIDDFDEHVHLWNLLSPGTKGKAIVLLRNIVDAFQSDNFAERSNTYPAVLIVGKEGTRCHAKSLINSFAFETTRECRGSYFDHGVNSKHFFYASTCETAHLLTNIDEIGNNVESVLWRYLKFRHCAYWDIGMRECDHIYVHGLIVLTASDITKVKKPIVDAVDYVVQLEAYTSEQLRLILHQRLSVSQTKYAGEPLLAYLVDNSDGTVRDCIDLLKTAHLLMRSQGRMEMLLSDVEKAVKIA